MKLDSGIEDDDPIIETTFIEVFISKYNFHSEEEFYERLREQLFLKVKPFLSMYEFGSKVGCSLEIVNRKIIKKLPVDFNYYEGLPF